MMQTKYNLWSFPLSLIGLLMLASCTLNPRLVELMNQTQGALERQQNRNFALDEGVRCTDPRAIDGRLDTFGYERLLGSTEEIGEGEVGKLDAERVTAEQVTMFPTLHPTATGFLITLPEEKPVSKIVIHAPGLLTASVEVSTQPGEWTKIKEIKKVISPPIVITGFFVPRIKNVRLLVKKVRSFEYKGVQEIELYGLEEDEALATAKGVVSANPNDPVAHRKLGLAYLDRNRFQEAIAELEEAVRLQPESAEVHIELGIALQQSGKVQEAIEAFREAVRLDNTSPEAHFRLAVIYDKMGQCSKAVSALKETIKLRPTDSEAAAMLERLDKRRTLYPTKYLPKSQLRSEFFVGMSEQQVIEKYGQPTKILPPSPNFPGCTKRLAYGEPIVPTSRTLSYLTFEGSEFILGEAEVLGFHKVYFGDINAMPGSSNEFPELVNEIPEALQSILCDVINEEIVDTIATTYKDRIVQKAQIIWVLDSESWLASVYTTYPARDFRFINESEPRLKDYRIMELLVTARDSLLNIEVK